MYFILSTLWFIREIKSTLFWLYLWQLKEYHIGRFIDHFRTEKGKKLLLNKLLILKIVFLITFISLISWRWLLFYGVFFIYFLEVVKRFFDFFKKRLIKPIFTKKIIFLTLINLAFLIFYLLIFFQREILIFWLLVFDILTPAIVSGIVLVFQPFTALLRNQIIKKAKKRRGHFKNLLVIGITGSYGKTSAKEFLYTILADKFGEDKVLKTKEHQNSEVGISQCILNDLKPEHDIFIVEMGAYNRGGIKLLCDIVKPKIGIVTGVNEQHLATFGSMENLLSAEGGEELIDSLPKDGLAIFNGNNKYSLELYKKTKIKKKICHNNFLTAVENVLSADIWSQDVKVEKEFVSFKVLSKDGDFADFKVNLLGAQNVENILLATCCAKELGMNLKEISNACEKIKPEQGGMKLIKTKNGLNIIDSTYSANPDGVISHLEYLKIWPGQTLRQAQCKKVIAMPCLIELGKASKEVHKRIGKKIGEVCAPVKEPSGSNGTPSGLAIITTKDKFKEIRDGSTGSPQGGAEILFIEDSKKIVEKIKNFTKPNDIVLLEGRIPREVIKLLSD